MAIIRPSSDILTGWSPTPGGTSYTALDETTADNADYISASSAGLITRVGLGSTTDPGNDNNHVLRYRADHDNADGRGAIVKVIQTGSFPAIVTSKQPWRSQPQVPVEVDPIWYQYNLKSVIAFVGNKLTDLSIKHYASDGGVEPSGSVGQLGIAANFSGTQSRRFLSPAMSSAPATRIVAFTPSLADGTFSGPDGGTNGFHFRLYAGALQTVNSGIAVILSAGTVLVGETCVAGAVYSSGRNEIWKNGKLLGSNTSTGTSGNVFQHYIGQRGNGTEFFQGKIYLHLDFGSVLPRGLVEALSSNPWQIFRPINRISYHDLGYKLIATATPSLTTSPADYTINLTSGEAANITDYSALAIEVEST